MLQEDLYKKILSGLAFKRWELNCLDVALFFKQELYTTSVRVLSSRLTEGLCCLVYTPGPQLGEISTDSLAGSSLTCFPTISGLIAAAFVAAAASAAIRHLMVHVVAFAPLSTHP